jgi:hypothetical protein
LDIVREYLEEAGILFGSPEYGHQWNLCHASLGSLGMCAGLDDSVKTLLRSKGLGKMTVEGLEEYMTILLTVLKNLVSSQNEPITLDRKMANEGWIKYCSGAIIPIDTVIQERIVSKEGEVIWTGMVYTGIRSQKVGYRASDNETRPMVRYSEGQELYWRETGLSKQRQELQFRELNRNSTGWDFVAWYLQKNPGKSYEDAVGFALFQCKISVALGQNTEKNKEFLELIRAMIG